MSRSKAREAISMDDFKCAMDGIYTTSVNEGTLDESPMAYKNAQEIVKKYTENSRRRYCFNNQTDLQLQSFRIGTI